MLRSLSFGVQAADNIFASFDAPVRLEKISDEKGNTYINLWIQQSRLTKFSLKSLFAQNLSYCLQYLKNGTLDCTFFLNSCISTGK